MSLVHSEFQSEGQALVPVDWEGDNALDRPLQIVRPSCSGEI
jgi:hypothetical protein